MLDNYYSFVFQISTSALKTGHVTTTVITQMAVMYVVAGTVILWGEMASLATVGDFKRSHISIFGR